MKRTSRLVALVLCVALVMSVFAIAPMGAGAATESEARTAYNNLITEYNKYTNNKANYTASSWKKFSDAEVVKSFTADGTIAGQAIKGATAGNYIPYKTVENIIRLGGFKGQSTATDYDNYKADLEKLKTELVANAGKLVDGSNLKNLIASVHTQLGFKGSANAPYSDYANGGYVTHTWDATKVSYNNIYFGSFSKIGTYAQPEIAAGDLVKLINALGAASVAFYCEDSTVTDLATLYNALKALIDNPETSVVEGVVYLTDARKALKDASAAGTGSGSDGSFRPVPNSIIKGGFAAASGSVPAQSPSQFYYVDNDYDAYFNTKDLRVYGAKISDTVSVISNDTYNRIFTDYFKELVWSGRSGAYVELYTLLNNYSESNTDVIVAPDATKLSNAVSALKKAYDKLKPTWSSPYVTRYNQAKAQFAALDKNGYEYKSYAAAQMAVALADMHYARVAASQDPNGDVQFQNAVTAMEAAIGESTGGEGLISLKNLSDMVTLAKELVTKDPTLLDDSVASQNFRIALAKAEEALVLAKQPGSAYTFQTLYQNSDSVYNNLRNQYLQRTPSNRESLLKKALEVLKNGVEYDANHQNEISSGVLCGKKHYPQREWSSFVWTVQKLMKFDGVNAPATGIDREIYDVNNAWFSYDAVKKAVSNLYVECTSAVQTQREAEMEAAVAGLLDISELMNQKMAVDKAAKAIEDKSSVDYNVAGMNASEQALRSSELKTVSNQAQSLLDNAANQKGSVTYAAIVTGTIDQLKAALARVPKTTLTDYNKSLQSSALAAFDKLVKENYTAIDYAKGKKVYDELKACDTNSQVSAIAAKLNTLTSPYSPDMISIEANVKKVNDQLKVLADLRSDPKMNKRAFAALDRVVEIVNNYLKNRVYSEGDNGVTGAMANEQLSKYVSPSYLSLLVPSQNAYNDVSTNLFSAAAIFTCDSAYYDELDAFNATVAADYTADSYNAYKDVYNKIANFVPGTAVTYVSGYMNYYDNSTKQLKAAREALRKGEMDKDVAKKLDEAKKAAQAILDTKDSAGNALYTAKSISRIEAALKMDTSTTKAANEAITAINKAVTDAEEVAFNFTGKRFKGAWVKKGAIKSAAIKTNFVTGDTTGKEVTYAAKSASPKVVQIGIQKPTIEGGFPKVAVKGLAVTGNNYVTCGLAAERDGVQLQHFFLVGVN